MTPDLESVVQLLGAWGYLGLGLAAFVEYLFPPFPGDTVVLLGGAWAAREDRSLLLVYLGLTLGSLAGMALTWRLGKGVAGQLHRAPEGSRVFGIPVGRIREAQAVMRARGGWLLVANRFLPSFRSVLFLAAGASEVPLARVLLLGTVSAVLFNGVLVTAGAAIGNNAQAIADFFTTFRNASLAIIGVIAAALLGRFLWKRARAQSRP